MTKGGLGAALRRIMLVFRFLRGGSGLVLGGVLFFPAFFFISAFSSSVSGGMAMGGVTASMGWVVAVFACGRGRGRDLAAAWR